MLNEADVLRLDLGEAQRSGTSGCSLLQWRGHLQGRAGHTVG